MGKWEVFFVGWFKWNVDVLVNVVDGRTVIGGVLRVWKEKFRCIFFIFMYKMGINEVEVLVIY